MLLQVPSSSFRRRRRRLKGIHSRPDTNRNGAEGLSFYYPRLLHCLDQMLAVMSLSQHRVSSSKTVRPRAPCGARCIGHAVSTWSAVCSVEPHSQFGEGARPHLCMDEWNRLTPVRRRLSLTFIYPINCRNKNFTDTINCRTRMESPNTSPQAVELNRYLPH